MPKRKAKRKERGSQVTELCTQSPRVKISRSITRAEKKMKAQSWPWVCVCVCVFASMEPHAATPFRSLTRNHNFSTKSFYVDRIEERNIKRKRQASDVTFKEY
jgi:hypothetical protein